MSSMENGLRSKFFHPKSLLDDFFEVGILLKMLDGIIETIIGLALLLIRPEHVTHWAHRLTAAELAQDPHDFIASHIVRWANDYTRQAAVFAAIYLLSHGIIKVVLVYEVLRNHLWAYLALIVVTFGFVVYQLIHVIEKFSVGFVLLTLFDFAIIYLTAREYAKQKKLRQAHEPPEA
jgi:uncharacterized membrane protein